MASKDSLFMGSTEKTPMQSILEIQRVLMAYGVTGIGLETEKGEYEGIVFKVLINGQEYPFRLPCRWKAVLQKLQQRRSSRSRRPAELDERDARRIAWRQTLRWVEAQMAMLQTGMVKMEEVFMPYLQVRGGKTLFEHAQEKGMKFLEGPKE